MGPETPRDPTPGPPSDHGAAQPATQALRFEVTPEDVIAYFVDRLMRADRSRAAIRGARASILSAGAVVLLFGATMAEASPLFLGAVLAATVASVVAYPAIFRRAGRRRIQAVVSASPPEGVVGATRVTLEPTGLVWAAPGGEETIPWAALDLSVTREHLLFARADDAARPRLVPARAFASEEDRARFIEAVRASLS